MMGLSPTGTELCSKANHPRLVSASLVEGWIVGLVATEKFKRRLPVQIAEYAVASKIANEPTYGTAKAKLHY
jgi:hypothetical protein